MKTFRPHYLPPLYQDAPDHGRLILRDGSTASIRISELKDLDAVRAFYRSLSPESRRLRFFSEAKPGEDVLAPMLDSTNPRCGMTLLVWRQIAERQAIIASGSYIALDPGRAEFAVAVDDAFHGKGLGGLLLERLSVLAATHGFRHFNAFTDASNHAMLEVFRSSGFRIREQNTEGLVEVDLDIGHRETSTTHAQQRDRLFTKSSLRPFFHPASVAVIGASRDPAHPGHRLFVSLLRGQFRGVVYPVNPSAMQISGVKAYPTATDLPETVDLAVIAVPAGDVLAVVDQCARRGVRAVVVISAGFAESGDDGRKRQQELVERIRSHGMRMLGPNCLGLINLDPDVRLHASLCAAAPGPGSVAISSQSGALGAALLALARKRDLGVSAFVSMGNKADVTGNDLLYFWEDDPRTSVILMYLESFGNPRRFVRIAREVSRRKPILCLKSGGVSATSLKDRRVLDALFHQSGVIRADSMENMFDLAALLSAQPLPSGNRIQIISNSHGAMVLCRDACLAGDLEVANIHEIDSRGEIDEYQNALKAALLNADCDAVVCIYMPIAEPESARALELIAHTIRQESKVKPVLAVMMAGDGSTAIYQNDGIKIPCFLFPEAAAHALSSAVRYRIWRDAPAGMIPDFDDIDAGKARQLIAQSTGGTLSMTETAELLLCAGIEWQIRQTAIKPSGAVDIEVTSDPDFGPVLAVGLSGEYRTVLQDVAYRMLPVTNLDAGEMLQSLRAFPLLEQHGISCALIEELLLRISFLVTEIPDITGIELNGVSIIASENGISLSGDCAAIQRSR